MNKILFFHLFIFFLFYSLPTIAGKSAGQKTVNQYNKIFVTQDFIYEPTIKTVLLYPNTGNIADNLQAPVVSLGQSTPLILSFDDLREDVDNYYVKIIYCNADWTISSLNPIQYLYDYNEFFISNRQTSINTKVSYVHYTFTLPKVKISGNYVVMVYRDYNEEDLICTKRFMVYDDKVNINAHVSFVNKVSERDKSQKVNFSITYPNYPIINPAMSLKVLIRQNHRWDKAIYNLPPLFVKENLATLEYNYFNMENAFKGGNEFKAFDISSLISAKLNIGKIIVKPNDTTEVLLLYDKPTSYAPYTYFHDINGKYFIQQYETGDRDVTPDYAYVDFVLDVPEQAGKIYVIGAMNDWRFDAAFEMKYNREINKYVARPLLKQGYYNFTYTLVNKQYPDGNEIVFSGSHSQTENIYDILVYYRPPGKRADYLIAYKSIDYMAGR